MKQMRRTLLIDPLLEGANNILAIIEDSTLKVSTISITRVMPTLMQVEIWDLSNGVMVENVFFSSYPNDEGSMNLIPKLEAPKVAGSFVKSPWLLARNLKRSSSREVLC